MKNYSISDAARLLQIDRTTLRRWIRKKNIPTPTPGIAHGRSQESESECFSSESSAGALCGQFVKASQRRKSSNSSFLICPRWGICQVQNHSRQSVGMGTYTAQKIIPIWSQFEELAK